MKIGITYRLFLVILAATGLAVVSMLLIMHWSIDRGFHRYVNSIEQTQLTRLAERLGPQLVSMEINPLRVDGATVEALDAAVIWRSA